MRWPTKCTNNAVAHGHAGCFSSLRLPRMDSVSIHLVVLRVSLTCNMLILLCSKKEDFMIYFLFNTEFVESSALFEEAF